jgi:hypothetical protein
MSLRFLLWTGSILPFFARVPSDVIYLQLCAPKVVGLNLHLKQIKCITSRMIMSYKYE